MRLRPWDELGRAQTWLARQRPESEPESEPDYWYAESPQAFPDYQQTIDDVIRWAEEAGLDVMLALAWSDRGVLGGCDINDGRGCQQLMADRNSVTFWKQVAEKYKGDGRVLFDLYSEPEGSGTFGRLGDCFDMTRISRSAIVSIWRESRDRPLFRYDANLEKEANGNPRTPIGCAARRSSLVSASAARAVPPWRSEPERTELASEAGRSPWRTTDAKPE